MADEPKKPSKPAFYKNKNVTKNQMAKGEVPRLPAATSFTPQPSAPEKVSITVPDRVVREPKIKEKPGGRSAGDFASLSKAQIDKLTQKTAFVDEKLVKEKQRDASSIKSEGLEARLEDLGDLKKLNAAMGRTRPSDSRGAIGMRDIEAADAPNTKVQKSHALSMRYRIPAKLESLFNNDPEKLKKLSHYIFDQLHLADTERSEYIQRLAKFRQAWKDFVSAGLDPAFEGAHNVHIPMAYANIKAMHARIYQAVMNISPRFSLKPRTKIPELQKEDKEELLNWVINDYSNMQQGWDETVDEDIWNFVADGIAVTKQYWLRDVRKFTDVEETVKRPIELDDDGFPVIEEKEVEKEEVLFDCPMIEPVKLEDFWIIGKRLWDVDKADIAIHLQDYSKSDLIKSARLGFFHKAAVDEVIAAEPQTPGTYATTLGSRNLQHVDDFSTGVNKAGSRAGIATYKILEVYLRYDIDDDGIDEELVVWVEDNSRKVLRITYLERVGPGGKRPFTIKPFTPDGKGLGELLYGLNNEIDYIHNQRLDYGTIQNLPFFFYRAASGLNPIQLKVGPGMGIPVDDPQGDVMFPQFRGGTNYGFQEEQQVTRYGEKTSGITEFAMGQIGAQGATRTATGTAALVNELNANIDIHIKRYQRGFKRNLYILDLQCQDLLPLGTIIRVSGVDGKDLYKRFEDREALRFAADFELTANSINSNKAIERETAQMLVQQLANPIALQTGIATQENLYQAFKNMLQKFEIKDVDAYITKPQGAPDSPYSAKEEINMIIAGVKPPLVIKDRHEEKLAFFTEFEKHEEFSWLTEGHMPLYLEVRRFHEQMSQAIAAQAANPLLQQGVMDLGLSAQLAAGAGAPQGVAQQQSDLGQGGGQLRPELG